MKKTKLLTLTALTLIGLLGLSSCGKGEKGDKGDTGPAGATGETGPKGDKGEDGKDGIDGSTWLTGSGVPSSNLGKEGDMYLNTSNGDVYQKESTGWTLKMNIKGEDGSDGEDGKDGLNGSSGSKGETAWSNTILPSSNGYIIPSIGGGIKNTPITFKLFPDNGFILDTLKLNDKEYKLNNKEDNIKVVDNHYELSTTMIENGYVVSATFIDDKQTNIIVDGKTYSTAKFNLDGSLNEAESTLDSSAAQFEGGDGVNEPLLISNDTKLTEEQAKKLENGLDYKIDVSSTNESGEGSASVLDELTKNVAIDKLEIDIEKDTTLNLDHGFIASINNLVLNGSEEGGSQIIKNDKAGDTQPTAFFFSMTKEENDGLDEDINIEINNIDFKCEQKTANSAFINVKQFNNVDINISNTTYKSSSTGLQYGVQVIGNTGKVNIDVKDSEINLGSPDGKLIPSYYPFNLQNNEGLNLNISGSTLTGWCSIYCKDIGDTITADNCTFNVVNNSKDKVYSFTSIIIDGGNILNPSIGDVGDNNKISVSNSTFNIKNEKGYAGLNIFGFQYGAENNYIEFKNNTYKIEGNPEGESLIFDDSGSMSNSFSVIDKENKTEISNEILSKLNISKQEVDENNVYEITLPQDLKAVCYDWRIGTDGKTEFEVADASSNVVTIPKSSGELHDFTVYFEINVGNNSNAPLIFSRNFVVSDLIN